MTVINSLGGKIHLFITFTMDRRCPDFAQMLNPNQTTDGLSFLTCRLYWDRLLLPFPDNFLFFI